MTPQRIAVALLATLLVLALPPAVSGQPGDCCDWAPTVGGMGKCTEVYCGYPTSPAECIDHSSWRFNGTVWGVCVCWPPYNQTDPYCCPEHKFGPKCDQCADDTACPPFYKCSHKIVGGTYYLCNASDPTLTSMMQADYPRSVPQVQATCSNQFIADAVANAQQARQQDSVEIVCKRTNCTAYAELDAVTRLVVASLRTTTTITCNATGSCQYSQAELLGGASFGMRCEAATCFPNLDDPEAVAALAKQQEQLKRAEVTVKTTSGDGQQQQQDGSNCTLVVEARFPFVPDRPAATAPYFTCQLLDCAATVNTAA